MLQDKLRKEIQLDESYKYIRQVVNGTVKIAKFEGNLAVLNYYRDRLTVSPEGLVMFKGTRFLVPEVLRPGLLRALHSGHAGVGSQYSDAVTEALLCYANTKCRVLKKSPAELAFGRCLKDFFPRQVSSLLPIPENLMSGPVKDRLQENIREDGGLRWSEHSKVLPPSHIGQWVQMQNFKGSHPLKSDYSGEIVGNHNVNSYAVKVNGTGQVPVRNRASLWKIPPPVPIHIPVTVPNLSRPASGPRPGLAAPPAPSMVTRSRVQVGTVPRQSRMMKGPNEGPRHARNVPRQNSLKPNEEPSQAFYEDTCDKMMRQVTDWDYPGNIVRQALHKPPALATHVADSGQSNVRAGAGQPGQPASVREQVRD